MANKKEYPETGFSKRFKQFLAEHKLNANKLAKEISGTDEEAIVRPLRVKYKRWEDAAVDPGFEGLCLIASKFDVSLDWLALGVGEMVRSKNSGGAQNLDYKALYEKEQADNIRMMKGIIERSGLLVDREGSKIESDGQTTDECKYSPAKIGYVQEYMIKLSEKQIEKAATQLEGMEAFCQRVMIEAKRVVLM